MSKNNVFPNRHKDKRTNLYSNFNQSEQKYSSGQRRLIRAEQQAKIKEIEFNFMMFDDESDNKSND
jgi:hypothetical protein